ncbi:MAG: hypothetical protein JEY91_17345, partial [Spirochaetaceae bacterium]|nr:hypothetical protein [Spirochaetaceae bacterium]
NQQFYQENSVVNYPNNYNLTRITEFKYFQKNHKDLPSHTIICQEHPIPYVKGVNDPYYVVNTEDSRQVHQQYRDIAAMVEGLTVLGRLAEYRYYDMDQIVAVALNKARKLCVKPEVDEVLEF